MPSPKQHVLLLRKIFPKIKFISPFCRLVLFKHIQMNLHTLASLCSESKYKCTSKARFTGPNLDMCVRTYSVLDPIASVTAFSRIKKFVSVIQLFPWKKYFVYPSHDTWPVLFFSAETPHVFKTVLEFYLHIFTFRMNNCFLLSLIMSFFSKTLIIFAAQPYPSHLKTMS